MRSKSLTKKLVVKGILSAFLAATSKAYADAPAAKWYDTIGMSGYVQGSYVANLNNPLSRTNTGRQFDTSSNSFNFNSFLLQIAKPVGDSDHYGFTVRLRTGQDATSLPSGGTLAVQEGYMTYAVPALTKLQFIAGRFVTSEGFEGVDTVNNPNFSEGLLFTMAEPISHVGLKANYTFSPMVNATLGVVNGWNVSPDNNDGKTILWQVATTPTKQTTWSFQGLYGKESPDPSHSQRLSLDTVAGFNPTDKLSLNVQGNWGQQNNDPGTVGGSGTTHWVGAGLWASFACTSKDTESIRFEVLSDQNGANIFEGFNSPLGGVNAAVPSGFAGKQTVKEFTITHKHMMTTAMGMRVEFRHDWSNAAYFERHEGGAVRNQNTIATDLFVTF